MLAASQVTPRHGTLPFVPIYLDRGPVALHKALVGIYVGAEHDQQLWQ